MHIVCSTMTGNSIELACIVSCIKKGRHKLDVKNVVQYRKETCYKKIVEY